MKSKNPMKELREKKSASPIQRKTAPKKTKKKRSPIIRGFAFIGIVFQSIFEELGRIFKKIPPKAVAISATAVAVAVCAGLIFAFFSAPSAPETVSEPLTDLVLGESSTLICAEERKALSAELFEEKLSEITAPEKESYTVTFDFFAKEDVVCLCEETTVSALMEKAGVTLSATDALRAEGSEVISSDKVITIDEVVTKSEFKETAIPFETTYKDVQTIPRGTQKTHTSGVNGTKTSEYSVTYVNGVETERTFVSEKTTKSPQNAVVYKGVGGTVDIGGVSYSYSYYLDCNSTCYTGGGTCATGLPANEKVIAVDPTVIPYYTNVYIPGIGIRIAADCGGGIKGNIIDIYFDEDNPLFVAGYGWKPVRVYILDD